MTSSAWQPPADTPKRRPLAFYDADCRLCSSLVTHLDPARVETVPLQDAEAVEAAGLEPEELACSLHVVAEGEAYREIYRGAEAVVRLFAASYPCLAWLARLYRLPGVAPLAEALYGWVARHRHWLPGAEKSSRNIPGGAAGDVEGMSEFRGF